MYCSHSLELLLEFPIKLYENQTREQNVVVSIAKSEDEEYLAFISGKRLLADEKSLNQLFIYQRRYNGDSTMNFDYVHLKTIDLKQKQELR